MEDFENDSFDLTNEGDRNRYDQRYLEKIKELSGGLDGDEQNDVISQMENLRYNPSNSPENDGELNFLRSRNIVKQKNRFDPHTESLLRDKAERTGKPISVIKREARNYLRGVK